MTIKLDPEAKRVVWNAIEKHLPHIAERVRLENEGPPADPLADIFGSMGSPELADAFRKARKKRRPS